MIDQLLNNKTLIGKGATSITYKVKNILTGKGFLCLKILNEIFFNSQKNPNDKKNEIKSSLSKKADLLNEEENDDDEEEEDNEEENEPEIDFDKVRQLFNECEILDQFNHPNIVKIYGFYFGDKKHSPAILLEYCKNNLETVIKKLNNIYLVGIIYEICSAMKYIHEKKIIHRDLKMANILINLKNHVKICDFGISRSIDMTTLTHGIGTIAFMAPELFDDNEKYDEKVDVYSFGVVMYFILTKGQRPKFKGTGGYEKLDIPSSINELSKSIIKSCWSNRPKERPSFNDIIKLIVENDFNLIDGIENSESKAALLKHLGLDENQSS